MHPTPNQTLQADFSGEFQYKFEKTAADGKRKKKYNTGQCRVCAA
jgi:hypothetical protein